MPPISRYARFTWGLIVKFCRTVSGAIGKFARAVRERWPVLTVTILGICVPIYAMLWYLDIYNNLAANIAITGIVTAMPAAQLLSPPSPLRANNYLKWLAAFMMVSLVFFIGDKRDWLAVSFNAAAVFIALSAYFVIWLWIRGNWFLMTGLILSLVAMMVFWTAFWLQYGVQFELLLLPLMLIMLGGIFWAPPATLILESAERRKNGRISGPGWQALAMGTLFLPVTLVTITVPHMLNLGAIWSNVSLALIGILLSAVISEPLRRLFIEWGNLSPDEN